VEKKEAKFVVVTGGVLSGLGKGLFVSSLGTLLKSRGYNITPIKIDPYVNVDAGTMNPTEHGEVFVLSDGGEVDMDLGNYERFLDKNLTSKSNITTGKIFKHVIEKERRGDYLGKTVQPIPHVTGELRNWYTSLAENSNADIVLIEVGGTVGDIENLIFLESLRELSLEKEVFFVHVTLVPVMGSVGEQKTKPAQQSVRMLRELGIFPNMIFCRSEKELFNSIKGKIAQFCGVKIEDVISGPDLKNIYEIPLVLEKQHVAEKILRKLNLPPGIPKMQEWENFVSTMNNSEKVLNIAVTGKYMSLKDSYVSVIEALHHAATKAGCKINLRCIETTEIEEGKLDVAEALANIDGIVVPGGFGSRGTEGKIACIQYAREKDIPFLGLCLGFQLAVVEFARNVCLLDGANSTEIDPSTKYPVIHILEEQKSLSNKGATMRLGDYSAVLRENSVVSKLYGSHFASERHRHRYEANTDFRPRLEQSGLIFSGVSPDNLLMEYLEIPSNKFFVATQAHPEFTSRPLNPNPLFMGFVRSCAKGN
jgi:CTP synthase